MSFKSEAAKVRSGIASGSYKQKSDPMKGFFDQVTAGFLRSDEAKRQEALEEKRETRAERRRVKAAQDAADKVAKDQKDLARFWLTSNSSIENNPQTQAAVLSAVKQGKFTDFSGLNDFMKAQSKFVPGVTGEPVVDQEAYSAMLEGGGVAVYEDNKLKTTKPVTRDPKLRTATDGTLVDVTPTMANPEDKTGRIEFGEQPDLDLDDLTETNYLPRLRTAELAGNIELAAEIEKLATESGWNNTILNIKKTDMLGKGSDYWADLKLQYNETSTKTQEGQDFIEENLTAAKVREAEPAFWKDETKLANYSANTLEAFLLSGKYEEKTEAYKAIETFLKIVKVQEGNAGIETLIGANPQKIDQYIKARAGTLTIAMQNTLTDMRSIAEEYELKGQASATFKQLAQQAFITSEGVKDLTGDARVKKLAEFEKSWKFATTISETDKLYWQKPEQLSKMSTLELNTLLKGPLSTATESDEYKAVLSTYEAKKSLETGNLDQLQGKSVLELDQFMITNAEFFTDPENQTLLAQYEKIKSLAVETEREGTTPRLLTTKQLALESFLVQEKVSTLKGAAYSSKLAEFERDWTASLKVVEDKKTTYTPAMYAAELIKYTNMAATGTELEQIEANKWMEIQKPIIESTLSTIANLDDTAKIQLLVESQQITPERAAAIVTGTLKTSSGPLGVDVVDLGQGTSTRIGGTSTSGDTATGTSITADGTSTSGDFVFTNPDGSTDVLITAAELAAAQEGVGLQGRIENLQDVSSAFGVGGWVGKLGNQVAGLANAEASSNVGEAQSALKALEVVTILQMVTMFPNIRDSVALKKQLEQLIPKVGKAWYGKPKALQDFNSALGVLQSAINTNQNQLQNPQITITAKSKAEQALEALIPLSKVYETIISGMESNKTSETGVSDTSSIFKVGEAETRFPAPSDGAKRMLLETPSFRYLFDEQYGPGAADLILTTSNEEVQ